MALTFEDRDEYLRKTVAEKIIKLIDAGLDISPMVIDGSWGTGKTEFSQKLCSLLSKEHKSQKVIYIDAFKEDHCEDPLLTITAAIAKELPEKEQKALVEKMIPAIKFGLKTVAKAGAGWLLKQNTDVLSDEFQAAIKNVSEASIDGTVENLIKEHIESEQNINALKLKIAELASKERITIIIDELDRCRPNFSVSLLEKVKHIFDIPNVTIILVTNLDQLKAAINHTYGATIDSQNYLDKFVKYAISLPSYFKPDGYTQKQASKTHWLNLTKNDDFISAFNNKYFKQINELLELKSLSLREVETLFRYFQVYQKISGNMLNRPLNYSSILSKMIAIYLYCFGDRRLLSEFPSRKSISSALKTLDIEKFHVDLENKRSIPHLQMVVYRLIEEAGLDVDDLLPTKPEEKEFFKERASMLTKDEYSFDNFTDVVKDVFEVLSLI